MRGTQGDFRSNNFNDDFGLKPDIHVHAGIDSCVPLTHYMFLELLVKLLDMQVSKASPYLRHASKHVSIMIISS
jgi:hypothetical protein